jgi:DNA-binding FadR family transcriptional regulator
MPPTPALPDAGRSVVFAPLDGTGRVEQVAQRLIDAIAGGLLRDGERLPSESDLSRSLGVALVTAREALEVLRDQQLVRTRRGRDGGSFVTYDRDAADRLLGQKLRDRSRIELRDLALHAAAIHGAAAESAADRASEDDVEALRAIHRDADLTSAGGARRTAGQFQLEVAAVSQSPRLVREEVRLQGEAGPLLWLSLREADQRAAGAAAREQVLCAIEAADAAAARTAAIRPIFDALQWLIEEKTRLDLLAQDARVRGEEVP